MTHTTPGAVKFAMAALVVVALGGDSRSAAFAAEPAGTEQTPANTWRKAAAGKTGQRVGAVLVAAGEPGKMLYFGGTGGADLAYMQAFDPAAGRWSDFSAAKPPARRGIHVYYQVAHDPKGNRLYCLSGGPMYSFDLASGTWREHAPAPALEGLSWHAAAIDPEGRKLVVVGADKRPDNLGWTRTVILDLTSGKWRPLPPPDEAVVAAHKELVAAREATIDLVGRTRLAWYRDPDGRGTDAERKQLAGRCERLRNMPATKSRRFEIAHVADFLAAGKTLAALRSARALLRRIEEAAERQYPVPPSRRNSPLVFDAANKVFVLFGGDHEDYLTNDTWVLDLSRQSWRRAAPQLAPSPRAGHAMVCLPGSGKIALYEGYVQSNTPWYGAGPWQTIEPRQLWLYDVKADQWDLLGAWRSKRGGDSLPAAAPGFYGYARQHFSPPALAADGRGRLVLVTPGAKPAGSATWMLRPDPSKLDAAGRQKLGHPPNTRLYRKERFLAAYCEVPDPAELLALESLPANRWVKQAPAPRNVAYGCRQRDWGTAVWDSANDQILLWGGGHCVRSASCPLHYSPVSGRMVEGYDADEPYTANGGGGFGSSLLNRPWIGPHAYNAYAYDPNSALLVTASGFCYDPQRMDWLREGPMKRPFRYIWSATVMEATPHGAVVWAQAADAERIGLWRFDRDKGWQDLKPSGKLYRPYCDSEGMTYDAKRDRMLLGWGGGYQKAGDGSLTAFDFKTRTLRKITPANADLGRIHNTREMLYLDHADWLVFAEPFVHGQGKAAQAYLRVYDCGQNKYFLLAADKGPDAPVHSQGWCYDAKRKLIYVITFRGDAYALSLRPDRAKLLEAPQAAPPGPDAPRPQARPKATNRDEAKPN